MAKLRFIKHHLPCQDCGSSDAVSMDEEGGTYCHSCGAVHFADEKPATKKDVDVDEDGFERVKPSNIKITRHKETKEDIKNLFSTALRDRFILKDVAEFYQVKVSYSSTGAVEKHYYPYEDGKAYKVRVVADKEFYWVGKSEGLFGRERFAGGGKRVVVTEGEIDALSVATAYFKRYEGTIYPVVSIPSASGAGENSLIENREWLRSFDEIILMLDNDKAGSSITTKAIRILGGDKVKLVHYPDDCKDANDVLRLHKSEEVLKLIYNSYEYIPPGILSTDDLWKALEEYNETPSTPYPPCLHGINRKTKGMRKGEISLYVSGTGAGKSSLFREIMYHIITAVPNEDGVCDKKIGIVALEESPAETARKMAGLALSKNPAHEEIPLSELKVGFDKVFGEGRAIVIDHQGAMTDSTIMDKLEYLALKGCEYIFLDHITILISEGVDGKEGNAAQDKVMNDLLKFVKKHNVWLGLISHLRKTLGKGKSYEEGLMPNLDSIRGSGSTKQIAMDVIAFARNLTAKTQEKQNLVRMSVLKCRFTGLTGEVEGVVYDHPTGRMIGLDYIPEEEQDEFTEI